MRIWTTPNLNELFLEGELPLTLREHEEIKKTFVSEAEPDDIALLNMDAEYRAFYDAVQERRRAGRILFISSGAVRQPGPFLNNAAVLNSRGMEIAEIKQIIRFIIDLAQDRQEPRSPDNSSECGKVENNDARPIDDPEKIRDLFVHLIKKNLSVMLAFEITRNGEPVMARSTCVIKELRDGMLVLYNFRHPQFFKSLKEGACIKIIFPYKHESKEGVVRIEGMPGAEINISVPEKLFPKKDIRIQPKKEEPVVLYILIPNEPTTNYRVLDISTRGVGFLCARDLPVGGSYTFSIALPDPQAVVVTQGIIRHKKELYSGYQYGAEIKLHSWDADIMAKYIMKREGEITGLLRTL
jgi:hypothetical protein